jgi:hypothetical protein
LSGGDGRPGLRARMEQVVEARPTKVVVSYRGPDDFGVAATGGSAADVAAAICQRIGEMVREGKVTTIGGGAVEAIAPEAESEKEWGQ